ncbi:MAG: alkaline phosphatase family protein [Flavobacteriales bacterium]|nr:alkaline phosphatase family protein [Flavobacteriales bacterium]
MRLFITLAFVVLSCVTSAQQHVISGPMAGHIDYHEAKIWVQTSGPCLVQIAYTEINQPSDTLFSNVVGTHLAHACTAHLTCGSLTPGATYSYQLVIDGIRQMEHYTFHVQDHWQYCTEPPAFRLAVGSCTYINDPSTDRPGDPYGGGYGIFDQIASQKPDLMLWLGDNTYFRETDVTSTAGMQYRYTHTRGIPEMQKLLHTGQHYAIWDDHDYGPDNSNRSFYLKNEALECFQDFWANPGYGLHENAGVTTTFSYMDVDFFLLDNRWFRTDPDIQGIEPTILGEEQILWLIESLKVSTARFKVVCMGGQFLSDFAKYENYALWGAERQRILDLISDNNIKGVFFLTGDRHSTELSSLKLPSKDMVYDLTVSPLTSTSYDHSKEANHLRVEGTHVGERNFAILDFAGDRKDRTLTISVYNGEGELQWEQLITEEEQ